MFQYRIALAQMRRGASEREIARSHCMGRHKLADLRALAEQHGWLDTGIYRHAALPLGVPLAGPAIIEEMSATSVVLPGQHASMDHAGNIIIES